MRGFDGVSRTATIGGYIPLANQDPYGLANPWFVSSDVKPLATSAGGFTLNASVAPGVLARALDAAFVEAAWFVNLREPVAARHERIIKISIAAEALLAALGYAPKTSYQPLNIQNPGSKRPQSHQDLLDSVQFAKALFSPTSFRETFDHVQLAGESVSAIRRAALLAEMDVPDAPGKGGKKPSWGADRLFVRLASIFLVFFQRRPTTSKDRYDQADPGHLWAKAVIELARARSDAHSRPEDLALMVQVSEINEQAALADRLRDGWIAWKKLPDDEKWPEAVWWGSGIDLATLVLEFG